MPDVLLFGEEADHAVVLRVLVERLAADRGIETKVQVRRARDTRFWRLAQALSALYPVGTEEKRWVEAVLARKKGLGF
jgi:hypothetical protein